jgi:hypothetical protein
MGCAMAQWKQRGRGGGVARRFAVGASLMLALGSGAIALWQHPKVEPERDAKSTEPTRGASSSVSQTSNRGSAPRVNLSGQVKRRDGAPIAKARVCASCASCGYVELPPAACVETDDAGRYTLRPGPLRSVAIAATAAGFCEGRANGGAAIALDAGARDGLDIVLACEGAQLAGIVEDALGGPIGGARIQLMRFAGDSRSLVELQSGSDGRFEAWTTPGPALVRAVADGYADDIEQLILPRADLTMRLTPASSIRGRVVDARSGAAAAGVEVRALPLLGAPRAPAAVSGDDGRFDLGGLEPGTYRLSALSERWRGANEQVVQLGLVSTVDDVLIEVLPAVSVLGRMLIGATGAPCANGNVLLTTPTLESSALAKTRLSEAELSAAAARPVPESAADVEADGTVRLEGLVPGRYHATLYCPDHLLGEGPELLDVGERNAEVVWRMTRGSTLQVDVSDDSGAPVPGAQVTLLMPGIGANPPIGMAFSADAEGRVRSHNALQPGTYTIEPSGSLRGAPVRFEVLAGGHPVALTLRVQGSGYIVVHAEDAERRPVGGLSVSAQADDAAALPANAVPLGAGSYRIGPLAAGAYTVEAQDGTNPPLRAEGPSGTPIQVGAGRSVEARIRLDRSAAIRGKVVDARGAPEDSLWVSATYETQEQNIGWGPRALGLEAARAMTAADGSFVIDGLERGAAYRLRAVQPFSSAGVLRDVKAPSVVTMVVPPAASIAGVIAGHGGALPRDAIVSVYHPETALMRRGRVSPDGRFAVDEVPPGRVSVSFAAAEWDASPQELELSGGQRLEGFRLEVQRTVSIAAGAPAATPEQAEPAASGSEPLTGQSGG